MRQISKAAALGWTLALVVFVASTPSRGETARHSLPEVLRLFPGYHVVSLKEFDPDTRNYLLENYPKANPSVVHADFDGDGSPDYALLLKNHAQRVTKVVILLCPVTTACKKVYDLDVSQMPGIVYLRPVLPGARVSPMDDVDTNGGVKRVKLRTAAVELNYFEKSSVVLHWNSARKKIEEIDTGD